MRIGLGSELTIAQVAELRKVLVQAFEGNEPVELDARELIEIDVAGLQLLHAAGRSAEDRGLELRFAEGSPGAVLTEAAAAAGLPPWRTSTTAGLKEEPIHG